ncbi:MAG: 5'-nucleotidase C-terminal domain-containing protein [Gemmatimonadaceae bacterium]
MRLKLFMTLAAATAAGCAAAPRGAASADLYVAATTDVHGRLRGWEYYTNAPDSVRGLTRAATIVDSLRAAHPGQVVLVDAGDLLQGNPLAYVAARVDTVHPHPVAAAMRTMRYDAAALGNHEFNYGLATLRRATGQAGFPFLAANAYTPDGRRAFPAYTIVERNGVKVGIVGATTPGSMVWDRENLRGRVVVRDIVPEARAAVAEARKAGAQVIVVAIHSGLHEPSSYDTVRTGLPSENVTARVAREVPGIDVIVFGHSHKEVGDTVINGVRLIQPRNWAGSVGVVALHLERAAAGWRVASSTGQLVRAAGHAESPAVLAATEQMHQATVRWATDSIGFTPVRWHADSARLQDTPLVDFILEVERRHTGADLASTAAFSLDAHLAPGTITAGSIAALYPYDNTLRVVRITGAQLRQYLEHASRYYLQRPRGTIAIDPQVPGYNFDIVAGADYALDLSKPVGSRVVRLAVKGKPVADSDSFTLALNNYRQTGGGGYAMLADAPVVYDRQEGIRELLIEEVRRRGTLRPEDYFQRNWELVGVGAGTAASRAEAPVAPAARLTGPRLRIIGTNDFHGALEPRSDDRAGRQGGAAYVASVIAEARAECRAPECVSILVDGGDLFQGTAVSNLSFGRPVLAWFNMMGYDAAALGNHEFDWGRDTLRALMRGATFPILGANARYSDGRDVEWVKDDLLLTRGGRRIGIIGLASIKTKSTTRAANTTGMEFPPGAQIVDSLAKRLRARGAEAIVVIAHDGAFCNATGAAECRGEIVDFASELRGKVDAIVAGHTHTLVNTTVKGIPVTQARSSGRAVSVVDVPLRATTDTARHVVHSVGADTIAADARVAALVEREVAKIAPRINRVVVTLPVPLPRGGDSDAGQYPLGNVIADAQRWAGKGDIAVMNNGGIRAPLPAGPVTWGQLFEVQPFGNILYEAVIPGRNLKAYFERLVGGASVRVHVSGVKLVIDTTRARGDRVVSFTDAEGRAFDPARSYRVIMNDFMATGGDNVGPSGLATTVRSLDIVDLDALVDYLARRRSGFDVPRETRIQVTPAR